MVAFIPHMNKKEFPLPFLKTGSYISSGFSL